MTTKPIGTLAQIKMCQDNPVLYIHGKPVFFSSLRTASPTMEGYSNEASARGYAEAGVHIYSIGVGTYGTPPEWCGPRPEQWGDFNFSTVETRYQHILNVDPQAYFFLRIHLEMLEWWQRLYPDECEVFSNGERRSESFASLIWREQTKNFLRAYIAHLQKVGLADRVIAYQPGGGSTTEWVKDSAMKSGCGDYSEPMRMYFRSWLMLKYHQDEALLRSAWASPYITFNTVKVPSVERLMRISPPNFRDPTSEQDVIDYFNSYADLCADLAIDTCRTVKEATNGQALAGTFFGKLFELAWNSAFFGDGVESEYSTYQRSGHLALMKVLESPYVDFITSSYAYSFRGIGGEGAPMLPTESVRLHGKLHLYDDDTRTNLSYLSGIDYGRPFSLDDSLAILKRNFIQVLTRGMAVSWIDGTPQSGHVDPSQEPAYGKLLTQFQKLGTFALSLDCKPSAEIAVLLDEESFFYETPLNDIDLPAIVQQRLWGLPKLGAPFDVYLMQDLLEGRLPEYKLYIFLNSFFLNKERRDKIKEKIQRDGQTSLWIYAPGYVGETFSLNQMTELTGFTFGKGDHAWGPFMQITNFNHPITEGLHQDITWGTNNRLAPIFHLTDDVYTTILGQVVYAQGRCRPGFGVKEFQNWKSIYIAAPNIPAPILRGIARYAGVHAYNDDGDVLYATPQLLGVHTTSGGQRHFKLPRVANVVYDLFENKEIAINTQHFSITLPPASTHLFYTGSQELLKHL